MIAGAAAWLLAPAEPVWWVAPVSTVVALAGAGAFAVWPSGPLSGAVSALRTLVVAILALMAAAALGFTAGQLRNLTVAQPAYFGAEQAVRVEGWVVANDASDNGPRLRLLVQSIEGVDAPPRYVRVSVSEAGLLTSGRGARSN